MIRGTAAVFVGGAAGALARTGLAHAFPVDPGGLPWATLVVNVLGCLLLGGVLVRTRERTAWRGALGPGLCGGLTTFSTFQLELVELLRDGDTLRAAAYAALSLALGLAAVDVGRRLGGAADRFAEPAGVPER